MIYMPIGIIGVAIATAAVPEISRHAAAGRHDDMRATVSSGIRLMLVLSVPATVGLMVLAAPIIELLFERGAFDATSTAITAAALFFYAPGIVGYSVVKIASPCFYAMKDARTPITISLVTIGTNLVLNLTLNAIMGFTGLALGTAIAANVNALLLLVMLARRIGGVDGPRLVWSLLRITLASLVMAAAAWWIDSVLRATLSGDTLVLRAVRVGLTIGAAIVVFGASAWLLRIDELRIAAARLSARFIR
jgi:putative peptidoglycan lipid II flippase